MYGPNIANTAINTIATKTSISAYSTNPCPSSPLKKRIRSFLRDHSPATVPIIVQLGEVVSSRTQPWRKA